MKQYVSLALCLVLTAALFTGCGCTGKKMDDSMSSPTVLPTNEEVWESTQSTTRATTEPASLPTTAATDPSMPSSTIDNGNGPLEDTTATTEAATEGRARSAMPHLK